MKFGMRKPSLKKSIKARTTGKAKRAVKKALIPGYGKKGMGWIKNPKKAAYNKVYNKTTFSVYDVAHASKRQKNNANKQEKNISTTHKKPKKNGWFKKLFIAICALMILGAMGSSGDPDNQNSQKSLLTTETTQSEVKEIKTNALEGTEKFTEIESEPQTIVIEETQSSTVSATEYITESEIQTEPEEPNVWIPSNGNKYHSKESCSNMISPSQVTLSEAENMGYQPCKRCY